MSLLLRLRWGAAAKQEDMLTLNMRHYNMAVNSDFGGTFVDGFERDSSLLGAEEAKTVDPVQP